MRFLRGSVGEVVGVQSFETERPAIGSTGRGVGARAKLPLGIGSDTPTEGWTDVGIVLESFLVSC